MRDPARDQVVVVFIRHGDRADFFALATSRAGIEVDVGCFLAQLHGERTIGVADNAVNLAVGHELHVGMMRNGRHFWRHDATGAVQRREYLAEQDGPPPMLAFLSTSNTR